MNSNVKTIIFWAVLICVAVLLWTVVHTGKSKPEREISYTQFMDEVEKTNVKNVVITGQEARADFVNEHCHPAHPAPRQLPGRGQGSRCQEGQCRIQGLQRNPLGQPAGATPRRLSC